MSRRKRVVAWVEVLESGAMYFHPSEASARHHGWPAFKLIEHDPSADAVVRAAVEWARLNRDTYGDWEPGQSIICAVERYERRRKR